MKNSKNGITLARFLLHNVRLKKLLNDEKNTTYTDLFSMCLVLPIDAGQ